MSTHDIPPIRLRGHFDGTVIKLDEPFELPRDAQLLITVLPPADNGTAIPGWNEFSADGLARAYGDNEPEYTEADLRP